jgi:hypothetical protein
MDQAQRSARGWEARAHDYPYHTKDRTKPLVYHVRGVCEDGKRIEPENLRTGGYGRELCKECIDLISAAHAAMTRR